MLNSEQKDEECDATKDDSSNADDYIKNLNSLLLITHN